MTIKECYQEIGGDYEDALSRFQTDERIKKFLLKFVQDQTFYTLCVAIDEKNIDEAFRASHTLKGIAQNLAFTKLYQFSSTFTEVLRNYQGEDINEAFQGLMNNYILIIKTIKEMV